MKKVVPVNKIKLIVIVAFAGFFCMACAPDRKQAPLVLQDLNYT